MDNMKRFIYYLRKSQSPNTQDAIPLTKDILERFGNLFKMEFVDFEKVYSIFNPQIVFDREKVIQFNDLIKKYNLNEHRILIALLIKKIEYDIPFLEGKIDIDVNLTKDIPQDTKYINALLKMFSYFIDYEKTYGENDALLKANLIFKPLQGEPIIIRHGFIIHSIVAAAFYSITGIKDIREIDSNNWEMDVKQQFLKNNPKDILMAYLSDLAVKINSFFISNGLAKNTKKQDMQSKVAKFIVDILLLSDIDKIYDIPDYKGVKYWIRRST